MGSIVKNYTDYYDNLFWNYNNSTEYRPLQIKDISSTGTATMTVDEKLEELEKKLEKKMEEWKGDNMEKIDNILERYKKYQIKEIDRQCDEDIKFIRDTSDLAKIYDKLKKQAEKELTKLYPNKDYEEIEHYIYISYDNDNKCQKDINERIAYRDEKIEEIKQKIEDVKVLISIAETFEQKMEILKNYNIIDEEGKINIYE